MFKWLGSVLVCLLIALPFYADFVPAGPAWYEHLNNYGQPIIGYDRWCWDDAGHTTMGEIYAIYVTYPGWPGWSCSQQVPGECANGTCCADVYTLPHELTIIHVLGRNLCALTEEPNDHPLVPMFEQCTFTVPPEWCIVSGSNHPVINEKQSPFPEIP